MFQKLMEATPVAALFAVSGYLVARPLDLGAEFNIYATLAAFLTASVVWGIGLARNAKINWPTGCIYGIVIGILSHPVHWYLMLAWNWVVEHVTNRPIGVSGEAVDPLTAIYGCFFYAFFSLIACGLQTMLASSATGVLAVALRSQLGRVRS